MQTKIQHQGLNQNEVLESRAKYGPNILTPPKRDPLWKLFLEKFQDPIIRILLIAAFLSLVISFVHQEFAETIGIFCAIFLSVGVAFWFEMDANKKFDVLNKINDEDLIKVIREGNVCEVLKKDIVVDDLILLETGEEIPADAELVESISLQVNESCLTGEPMISKTTNPEFFKEDATYASNKIYRGTTVMDGHCVARVFAVGDATEFGKVAHEATQISGEETPLNRQLDKLAKFIGVVGFILAALTFTTLFLKDIFSGNTEYSLSELGLVGAAIIGVLVALIKVWMPIIYDGLALLGKEKKIPAFVKSGSWLKWFGIGVLTFAALCGIGFAFGVNPFEAQSWISIEQAGKILQYFMVAVTLIVVAVPEGLPMSVTLSLALSMRRMLKTNNLVRKMHACETMGATTVICTDKTGTLTQNQMTVSDVNFYALSEKNLGSDLVSTLVEENISGNSTAFLDYTNPQKIKALGNPTEAALLMWLNAQGRSYLSIRESIETVEQLTFTTERKYMATVINSPTLGKRILYIKGAPEIVFSKCNNVLVSDGLAAAEQYEERIQKQLLQYQNQAMRTLGFAYREIEENEKHNDIAYLLEKPVTFMGIAAITDPLRPDVPAAVEKCLDAGINIKIVTGDTPGTAKEIARQIGIWNGSDGIQNIITGAEFEALPDDEASKRAKHLKIMCRARPTDKQRLVRLLQAQNEIVAVTGDGTNDAPALNFAQVGLSMGSGTSVAKEASDITLLDDSFNSIATAVMWGRSLYKNIQRFILFQLTINVAALVIVFLGSIFGQELPLTVTQMLWVNLIMDTFAAAALASLPPNENVMKSKPRRNKDFIINPGMRTNILFMGLSFVVFLLFLLYRFTPESGAIMPYDLSYFFTVFVLLQFWNMFNAKAFSTHESTFKGIHKCFGFILVAIAILCGQFLIVEFGGEVFRTVPLAGKDWLQIFAGTSIVLWFGELVRIFQRIRIAKN